MKTYKIWIAGHQRAYEGETYEFEKVFRIANQCEFVGIYNKQSAIELIREMIEQSVEDFEDDDVSGLENTIKFIESKDKITLFQVNKDNGNQEFYLIEKDFNGEQDANKILYELCENTYFRSNEVSAIEFIGWGDNEVEFNDETPFWMSETLWDIWQITKKRTHRRGW